MSGVLEVAGVNGFLGNQERVYREAEQETTIWEEFCSVWWDEFKDSSIATDQLFGLAVRHRLLIDIWGGRNDHSGRTRFGIAIKKIVDRVLGDFIIRGAGSDTHSKGQRYRLDMRRVRNVAEGFGDPDEKSLRAPGSPDMVTQDGQGLDVKSNLGAEKVPQPSATPRTDPWDGFLEDVDGPVS